MRTTARGREGGSENDLNVPVEAGSRYVALTGSCVERWEGWGWGGTHALCASSGFGIKACLHGDWCNGDKLAAVNVESAWCAK